MPPENNKHIDSDACRALLHFCNALIHMLDGKDLRTVCYPTAPPKCLRLGTNTRGCFIG
jgi:hypothetical protein